MSKFDTKVRNGGEFQTHKAVIKAYQWWENGDHPDDLSRMITVDGSTFLSEGKLVRRFRVPDPGRRGEDICPLCAHPFHIHGWIEVEGEPEGHTVCPGDYIVTNEIGVIYPVHEDIFVKEYNLLAGYGG